MVQTLSPTETTDKSLMENSFVIENIEKKDDSSLISNKESFLNHMKYCLGRHDRLNPNLASRLLNLIILYKGIFITDILYGVAFAEALGNAKYVVQQAEPDWLHFKDFWVNGLGELWQSSHEYPDQMHLFLLEDINLASPECYARPLLDIIDGTRKLIPYGKNKMPENLRIFTAKIPSQNPEIGLPLYSHLFKSWGATGFISNGKKNENYESATSFSNGYLTHKQLELFKPDEFEMHTIISDIKLEFENLFDDVE